jgi:superfamily II DNA or RNA helicase
MVGVFPQDDVYVRVECDDAIARELNDYFTFETPGAQFMRRNSRYSKWDGRIRLFKLRTRTLYRGLVPRIVEFCKQRDYSCVDHTPKPLSLTPDACLKSLTLPFPPKDYQEAALRSLLSTNRGIVLSPTGSGKSFIIYLLTRVLNTKTLIVVPSIGLVSQLAKDFQSYGFDLNELHTIQAGKNKER